MKWFWGTILIITGLIFLGLNTNYINPSQLYDIAHFWPVLLIIYGSRLIFRHKKYGWIITLIITLLALTFVYLATIGNVINYPKQNLITKKTTNYFSRTIPENTTNAKYTINTGAVNLRLDSTPTELIKGKLTSNYLIPHLKTENSQNTATVNLDTNSKFQNWPRGNNDLSISITEKIPLEMILNAGASKIDLDLTKIQLTKLDINTGVAEVNLQIGDTTQDNAIITINSGASDIHITFPNSIGVKVKNESPVSGIDFKDFQKLDRSNYQSKDYAGKTKKIKIITTSGASNIEISSK